MSEGTSIQSGQRGQTNRHKVEHNAWVHMIRRCHNPSSHQYKNYGGRGIRVCERWRNSFSAFLEDVGLRPSPGLSLDRINNDGDYEPGNVRWASLRTQLRNQRRNRLLEFRGQVKCVAEWAEVLGLHKATIAYRLTALGWDVEKALSTPLLKTYYINRPGNRKKKPGTS